LVDAPTTTTPFGLKKVVRKEDIRKFNHRQPFQEYINFSEQINIVKLQGMAIMILKPGGGIMSAPSYILNTIYSLTWLLAVIFALWIAGRIILRNISQVQENKDDVALEYPLILMIWLALGGLFAIPLLDLIGIIDAFLETFVPLFAIPASQFVTVSGTEPWPLFTVMRGALLLLVYGLALWLGLKVLRIWNIQIDLSIRVTPFEKVFMILSFGGLAHRAVEMIVLNTVTSVASAFSLQLGSQLLGWGISWILALLLLGIILLAMLNRLNAHKQ